MQIDMVGQVYGYWTVLAKDTSKHGKRNSYWICRCKCGTEKSITRDALIKGRSQSCGCWVSPNKKGVNATHGLSKTRIYHEWISMKKRCSSANGKDAVNYFLRNIRVCEEWKCDFLAFYDWAISHGYSDDLTIDRIDNSKGYSPDNCRWITIAEQQGNKTNNVYVLYNGQNWCLRTLCKEIGFPYKLAHRRYVRATGKGKTLSAEELFAPIHTEKIAHRYRKSM